MAKTKKEEAKSEVKTKAKPKYTLVFELNGESTTVHGDTVHEALLAFEKPAVIKTELVIKASHGSKNVEHLVGALKARRTLHNHTAVELFASNLTKLLG